MKIQPRLIHSSFFLNDTTLRAANMAPPKPVAAAVIEASQNNSESERYLNNRVFQNAAAQPSARLASLIGGMSTAVNEPLSPSPSQPAINGLQNGDVSLASSVEQKALILFQYTMNDLSDPKNFYNEIQEGLSIAGVRELACVFQSPVMNQLLDRRDQYRSSQEFFDSVKAKAGELVGCLNLFQKIKYGPRVKRLFDKLSTRLSFIEGLSKVYSQIFKTSEAAGTVDLVAYAFTPQRLPSQTRAVLDAYFQMLKKQPETQRRFNFWDLV